MLEEIVFNEISNTDFEVIDIGKKDMKNYSRGQSYIKNSIDIDEITNMLSKLKLSEVRSILVESSPEASYYIDFITETDEYVYLSFYQPTKYMGIGVDGKDYSLEKAFKIIDGNIDFILLDNLINYYR